MNLIIDVGNTRVKAAVFEIDTILEILVFEKEKILEKIEKIIAEFPITKGIISAVGNLSEEKIAELHQLLDLINLNHSTKVPFINKYATPKTLGVDRIALASGAAAKFPESNVLVIDAGTCITYDIVNSKSEYLGGAISPGLRTRYKALHHFTAKLPELETSDLETYIGNTTDTSIHSGVVNGIVQEIDGIINQYTKDFSNLTVVLTGGDTNFLAKQLKSSIFANQNFLLEGLQEILLFNN